MPKMSQLFEFATNHPFLAGGVFVVSTLVLVNELRLRRGAGSSIDPAIAVSLINKGAAVLDVRSAERFSTGHIVGARNIPTDQIQSSVDKLKRYTGKPMTVYCDTGVSCGKALSGLQQMGFDQAVAMRGGLRAWTQENMPLVKD